MGWLWLAFGIGIVVGWWLRSLWRTVALGVRIGWRAGGLSAREEWASLEDRFRARRQT